MLFNYNKKPALFTVLSMVCLSALLMLCGGKGSSMNEKKDTLTISLASNPMTLDPRLISDESSFRIIEQVFGFLVQDDTLSSIVPDIAESWEMPDDKTYAFRLKKGILFHDGKELTSDDVKYTFETILDASFGSPLRYAFEDIDEIITPDKYTVEFRLKRPNAAFLDQARIGIVPKHIAGRMGSEFGLHPVGSGPFRFVSWIQDYKIELRAYENFSEGKPQIEKLIFRIIPDAATRFLSLETGEIDLLVNDFPPEYSGRFERNAHLETIKRSGIIYEYIGLNLENKYLKNRNVRKAVAYALNREEMIRLFLYNLADKAYSPLPEIHWAYNPDVTRYEFNPGKSRMLLDKAGFADPDGDGPGYRFSLKYKCNSLNQESRQKAQIIQNYLKDVGINIEIESCEFAKLLNDIRKSRFDMYSLKWVGISDPDIFYKMFHSEGENRNNYYNPRLDHLIELGRKELNVRKRKEYYGEVQKIISEDLPYISLWHKTNIAVMNKSLSGFVLFPAGDLVSVKDMKWKISD